MADAITLPTTQRAYTLRLRGIDKNDSSWHDGLWATHEAVNKGVKVFGDWLLTLRGGLSHKLAAEVPEAPRKDRRILLALSWLSVEDERGAPQDDILIVAKGTDSTDARRRKLTDAFTEILKDRGADDTELGAWLCDCMPSLSAAIREDAVWVNRSAAFDTLTRQCPSLTRDDVWDFLEPFFINAAAYLRPSESAAEDDANAAEDKAKDLVQKAGGWLSKRMGTGGGANFERLSRAYQTITLWTRNATAGSSGDEAIASLARHLREKGFAPSADDTAGVLSVISGPGYKSATRNQVTAINGRSTVSHDDLKKLEELAQADAAASQIKIGGKGPRPYATMILQRVEAACGFAYVQQDGPARHCEFSVMLDHAARRVNVAHSWIKNAEAERRQFESDTKRLDNVPSNALHWLRDYCEDRSGTSGSLDAYRIRKRAIDGWDKVMDRWNRTDCQSADDRIAAARQLQDDPEIDKFGDIQLFEALADDDALCVWKPDGTPTAQPLKDFVAGTEAEAKKRWFKVPAYRHPDALRHPVFTDFGNSRWSIDFSVHRAPAKLGDLQQKVAKLKAALDDAERKLSNSTATQGEKRQQKVTECREKLRDAEQEFEAIRDRQRLELKVWNGQDVEPRALRWSCKRLVADLGLHSPTGASSESRIGVSRADRLGRVALGADESSNVAITGLFEQDHWNGRLQAPRAQLDAIAHHVDKHGWDAKAHEMIDHIQWLVSFSAELTQQGPWYEYVDAQSDKLHFLRKPNNRQCGVP